MCSDIAGVETSGYVTIIRVISVELSFGRYKYRLRNTVIYLA
jgi:hypothetical protein